LLAKKAVEKGLKPNPAVKASLAPGIARGDGLSDKTGLQPYLDKLGFNLVGYGCTTCIGNSGPLAAPIEEAIVKNDLVAAAVLSGNRNFEARVHQNIKANFLMSPPLVVAFALAGRVDIDLSTEPLGKGKDGQPVYLKDIWPTLQEMRDRHAGGAQAGSVPQIVPRFRGAESQVERNSGQRRQVYAWDEKSTYIQEPPFFDQLQFAAGPHPEIKGARRWAFLATA
jgi:aconitate hydratase